MSGWDEYSRQEFEAGPGIDPVDDGLHAVVVAEVGEPKVSIYDETKKDFQVWFAITAGEFKGSRVPHYIALPKTAKFSDRSRFHEFLEALGYDLSKPVAFDPGQWTGKRLRIFVKNKTTEKGERRPRVESMLPPEKAGFRERIDVEDLPAE